MQFLKEIREHLKDFETEASEEMHKFIDFLHTKYQEPGPAVVPPPAPLGTPQPAPVVETVADVIPPAADSAPVSTDPVVDTQEVAQETTPAEAPKAE